MELHFGVIRFLFYVDDSTRGLSRGCLIVDKILRAHRLITSNFISVATYPHGPFSNLFIEDIARS